MPTGTPQRGVGEEGKPEAYFLTTPRLGFRCWRAEDVALAWRLWGDPEVTRLIVAGGALTEAQVHERLQREITNLAAYGVQYWPCFVLESGEFAGCCGLKPYKVEERAFETGFHFCSEQWGKGLATEAARGVMGHAFGALDVAALFAGHHPKNEQSRRVLQKLGFRNVGEEHFPPTGLMHVLYRLTREEFTAGGAGRGTKR